MLSYRLFPVIRLLVYGWTFLLITGCAIAVLAFHHYAAALGGVAVLVLIHFVVRTNFRMQLKLTRDAIHHVVA